MVTSRGPTLSCLLLCVWGALVHGSSATTHTLSWSIPTSSDFFNTWAKGETFVVGDVIAFVYPLGTHNVYEVTPQDAATCDSSSPIQKWNIGNPKVTLDIPGTHSFICGFPVHCSQGMTLTLQVLPAAPVPAPPAPQIPPPTKAPPIPAPQLPPPTKAPPTPAPQLPPPTKAPPTPAPQLPPRTNPPPTRATPDIPKSPSKSPSTPPAQPEVPVKPPVQAPAPSPPKKKKSTKALAPAPAPWAPVVSPVSSDISSIAPTPFPETAGASVLRSTALMIVATLLVSCGAILF